MMRQSRRKLLIDSAALFKLQPNAQTAERVIESVLGHLEEERETRGTSSPIFTSTLLLKGMKENGRLLVEQHFGCLTASEILHI